MQVISGVLMISTIPVWIMFISSILGIEKTNKFQIFGVILSLLGVLFIITKSDIDVIRNLAFNRGDLIMATGMFAWALYSALLKKKTYEISQITLLEVVIITGLIFLIPIYILEMNFGNQIEIGKPFILTLSYVVLFPGLASFFFWIKGIAIIGANRAGVFLHLMPVFGSIMAILLFNEKFMIYHLLGAIFIIAGITLSNKKLKMLKVAILDDYQNVSQEFVNLKKLSGKYEIRVFSEPFVDENDAIEQLKEFEALFIMRERTKITQSLINNLKNLKYIITSGMRNKAVDIVAAKKRKNYSYWNRNKY